MISKTEVLQVAAASGNGRVAPFDPMMFLTAYVRSIGPVSAGAVQVEESDSAGSASWVPVGSAITAVTSDGGVAAAHLPSGCYAFLRARISTAIVSGTVTVSLVAST